jgi:tRNA(Ile)-lysidine synthase
MPAWTKAAQRDAIAGAAWSRTLLEEDDRALEAWLDALQPIDRRQQLSLAALAGKPRALVRRALHRWLRAQPEAGDLSRQAFETLLETVIAQKSTRQSLGSRGFAVTRRGVLRFETAGKRPRRFQRRPN